MSSTDAQPVRVSAALSFHWQLTWISDFPRKRKYEIRLELLRLLGGVVAQDSHRNQGPGAQPVSPGG